MGAAKRTVPVGDPWALHKFPTIAYNGKDMIILWLCNMLPPMVAEKLHRQSSVKEGWITGALNRMMRAEAGVDATKLCILYPVSDASEVKDETAVLEGGFEVRCFGFYEDCRQPHNYSSTMESRFEKVVSMLKPDVIHCFGTEYGHTLAMTRVAHRFGVIDRVLIGLQGLISECGACYSEDLPEEVRHGWTFRDLVRRDNVAQQQAKFLERGEFEKEALELACNVTGRTKWDHDVVNKINPKLRYFFMNETLRDDFYEGTWDITGVEKHSIFVCQCDYPLKGFHVLLEAMPAIIERFPDAHIYVAGNNICADATLKDRLKISTYGRYLRNLMRTYHLEDKVTYLGRLDAASMKKRLLLSHTAVCPSILENSPNSVGEAMILGVPVVASRTGGIPSILTEGEEGLLFEVGNSSGLSGDVIKIWSDDAFATEMSASEIARARVTHNGDTNYNRLLEIYKELCQPT